MYVYVKFKLSTELETWSYEDIQLARLSLASTYVVGRRHNNHAFSQNLTIFNNF